jgi:hypothetical protein
MRARIARLAFAALLFAITGPALAQTGDPVRGTQVYRDVCGMCHLPDPRQDRPARAIGEPGGVLRALETIGPMRFLQSRLTTQDIADVQAWLDTFAVGYIRDVRALNGIWFEPATSGQGFDFIVTAGDRFAVLFYGHRNDGANLILNGSTTWRPRYGETVVIDLTTVTGGRFGGFDPSQIRRDFWGRLTLRFDSCDRAFATLDGIHGRQVLSLQPLTRVDGLTCD